MKHRVLSIILFVAMLNASSQNFGWQTIEGGISLGFPNKSTLVNSQLYLSGSFGNVNGTFGNVTATDGDYFINISTMPGDSTFGFGYSVTSGKLYGISSEPPFVYGQEGGLWMPAGIVPNNLVKFLYALSDSEFLCGGDFTAVNDSPFNYLFIWNVASGAISSISDGLPGPATGSTVQYLNDLCIAYKYSSPLDPHIKVLDLSTRNWITLNLPNTIVIGTLFSYDSSLVISYLSLSGSYAIAQLSGDSFTIIGSPKPFGATGIATFDDGSLVVCGAMDSINETAISFGVAMLKDGLWSSFADPGGIPYEVVNYDGTLYAIGNLWQDSQPVGIVKWSTSTGINSESVDSSFLVYPNPSSGYLTVESRINDPVIIFNNVGTEIQSYKRVQNKTEINLQKFPSGIYLLQSGIHFQKLMLLNNHL